MVREGSRVDGGGGDDLLSNSYLDQSSVTLVGGAGNDTLVGNDAVGGHTSTAQDGYRWRVGASARRAMCWTAEAISIASAMNFEATISH